MNTKMRRTVYGDFLSRDLGSGAWHLRTGAPAGPEIYLKGVESAAAQALRDSRVTAVEFEWRRDEVLLTLISSAGTRVLEARHAIIHEPLANLYEVLPLVRLDQAARRFWRRVFGLVRIPGGRHLLRLIARRARGPG